LFKVILLAFVFHSNCLHPHCWQYSLWTTVLHLIWLFSIEVDFILFFLFTTITLSDLINSHLFLVIFLILTQHVDTPSIGFKVLPSDSVFDW